MNQELVTIEGVVNQVQDIADEEPESLNELITDAKFVRFVQGKLSILRVVEL